MCILKKLLLNFELFDSICEEYSFELLSIFHIYSINYIFSRDWDGVYPYLDLDSWYDFIEMLVDVGILKCSGSSFKVSLYVRFCLLCWLIRGSCHLVAIKGVLRLFGIRYSGMLKMLGVLV